MTQRDNAAQPPANTPALSSPSHGSAGVALIYTRVSGPGQEKDGTSLDSQEASCRAHAAAHGYSVGRVTREVGSGLELWDRQLLARDREALKHREYAALIVHDLDRLARNPIHQALVIEECVRANIAIEIVLTPLDTSPEGMLIAYVRGYAAQMEAEKIRERQMRGKRQRALNGRTHGSGPELYGYRRDHTAGVRRLYEPEASIVRRIYELLASEHLGALSIARRLTAEGVPPPSAGKLTYPDPTRGVAWSKSQILRMVRHPAYKGVTVAWRTQRPQKADSPRRRADWTPDKARILRPQSEWIALPDGVTPAIVSVELWQAAQDALASRQARTQTRNTARFYLLRGLVWCGVCGRRMAANIETALRKDGSRYYAQTYRCGSRGAPGGACGGARIPGDWLERAVWRVVETFITDEVWVMSETDAQAHGRHDGQERQEPHDPLARDLTSAERRITRIERQQDDLMRRYTSAQEAAALSEDTDDTEGDEDNANSGFPWELVQREVARLEREKRQWRATVVELEQRISQQRAQHAQVSELRDYLSLIRPHVPIMTPEERRAVLEALLARVSGNGRQVELWLAVPTHAGEDEAVGVTIII